MGLYYKSFLILLILLLVQGCNNKTKISIDSTDFNLCKKIIYNGNPTNKLDIVFIPEYYSKNDSDLFISDVNKHIDLNGENFGLLSVEPFKSNKHKFNFYRVDAFDNLSCYKKGMRFSSEYPCHKQVRKFAKKCPAVDVRIVLINKNISGINIGESTSSGGYLATVFVDRVKPKTTVHEFGHAFGDLEDEYINIINLYNFTDRKNCDAEGCPKWCSGKLNTSNSICYNQYLKYKECIKSRNSGPYCYDLVSHINHTSFSLEDCNFGIGCKEGTGCYWNCQSGRLFRPSKRGIMYSPYSEPFEFNKIDQEILLKKLDKYS